MEESKSTLRGENLLLAGVPNQLLLRFLLRYSLSLVGVAAGFGLRQAVTGGIGPGLPTYITFYPMVMTTALLGGFGPGLGATVLSGFFVAYWVLPPEGIAIASPVERVGLVLFISMGFFMSVFAELYRHHRHKAADYDKALALRKSEERLRLAQESANIGIWDWNVESGALEFTPELNKLYGLPPGTIKTYQDWREQVHPDDISRIEVKRDKAIKEYKSFDFEFRGRHSSGEYRWISTKGGALYDEAGKVIRVFGVNIDITERKQAEAALVRMSQLQSEGQKIAHLGSFEYIVATQTTIWSEEEFRIYGLNPAGQSPVYADMVARYIHPDDATLLHETFTAAMRSGSIYELEHRIVRPDGSVRWVYNRAQRWTLLNANTAKNCCGRTKSG